jgi:ribosomal protein L30
MGLKKPNKAVVLHDTATVRGMIRKVSHMLKVEEEVGETE